MTAALSAAARVDDLHRRGRLQRPGIYRTATGWRAFIRVNGVLYSRRFPLEATVQRMEDWRAGVRVARRGTGRASQRGTFGSDVRRYLAIVAAMPSLAGRRHDLEQWQAALGGPDRDRGTVSSVEVASVLAQWQAAGYAASSLNHRRTALSHLYRVLDGPLAPSPVRGLPRYREPDPGPRGLSYDVVRAILAALSKQGHAGAGGTRPADSLARVRLLVMAYTGLSPAEIKRLEPAHVDVAAASVWVSGRLKGRGTRGRTRPLTRQGVAALRAFVRAEAWGPFSTSTMRRAFRRAVRLVQAEHPTWPLRGVRPYDLRHSFATAVYRVTGNLDVTRGLLGHADQRTTLRYAAAAVADVERRAVGMLSRGGL